MKLFTRGKICISVLPSHNSNLKIEYKGFDVFKNLQGEKKKKEQGKKRGKEKEMEGGKEGKKEKKK